MSTKLQLRKIDTASTSAATTSSSSTAARNPPRSNTTSPVRSQPGPGPGPGGRQVGEYCDSPDSLSPAGPLHSTPRSRRRDTSPTVTVIGMQPSANRKRSPSPPPTSSSTSTSSARSEIPFIGGGFSRPSLTRRGSMSMVSKWRRTKWWRIVTLAFAVFVVWSVATRWWHSRTVPRKRLVERWWEQEDQLSPGDLSALLPRPTLPPRPLASNVAAVEPSSSHTLAQLLKLPSTLSTRSPTFHKTTYLAVVHLTSSSQISSSHLTPLVASLASQSPLAPQSILLLTPAGLAPPPSLVASFGPTVSNLEYSPTNQVPLVVLANHVANDARETDFVLYVDGHLAAMTTTTTGDSTTTSSSLSNREYVKTLLHALGTKPYASSIVSAGGLSLDLSSSSTSSSSSSFTTEGDSCVFPHYDPSSRRRPGGGGGGGVTRRISIPSTPFLFATSYLFPRRTSSSSTLTHEAAVTVTSPTILQGVPGLSSLPLEVALSWAAWTKSGIPAFALPLSLVDSKPRSGGEGGGDDDGVRAARGVGVDGWVCERLKTNLETRRTAVVDDDDDKGETWRKDAIRRGFGRDMGAGEGLRRIKGDRSKGGGGYAQQAGGRGRSPPPPGTTTTTSTRERNALERAQEMTKGSLVLLLSGRDELDAVRKIACRFVATMPDDGTGFRDHLESVVGGGRGGGGGDRELRIVVADWGPEPVGQANEEICHLEVTPLVSDGQRSSPDASISLPLIDMLDSKLDPAPAVVIYLSDGPRAREFEEVLKWMGGIFGVRRGGERLSRVRMEKESVGGGDEGKGRMTVIGIEREELTRADWIGALPIEALRHWHTPRIDVSVITNDRPVSLHRLLLSLRSTHYFSDDVSLSLNLEQTTDRLTHRLVDDFRWNHGPLTLRHRILLGGLMPAIVESWYPTSNDTYGVLLEDDVEVSPLFYGWLKFTILQYRYTSAGRMSSNRLFGVSLYQQKNIELRPEGRQPFDAHKLFHELALSPTTPYLSQIPCSWGAAYFPEQWREFHSYLSLRLSELALPISEPIVPAIRSNRWPKSWKKYFIELVYLRGYTMLYPNYPGFESLSTNHLEKGTHVKTSRVEDKKKALFEVPLLDVDSSLVDSLPRGGQLPEWDSLPVMDLWGAVASADELVERGWQTTRMIGSCDVLPDLEEVRLRYDARELLCKTRWRDADGADERAIVTKSLPRRDQPPPSPGQATRVLAEEPNDVSNESEQERARRAKRDPNVLATRSEKEVVRPPGVAAEKAAALSLTTLS